MKCFTTGSSRWSVYSPPPCAAWRKWEHSWPVFLSTLIAKALPLISPFNFFLFLWCMWLSQKAHQLKFPCLEYINNFKEGRYRGSSKIIPRPSTETPFSCHYHHWQPVLVYLSGCNMYKQNCSPLNLTNSSWHVPSSCSSKEYLKLPLLVFPSLFLGYLL